MSTTTNEALLDAIINDQPIAVEDLLSNGADPNYEESCSDKLKPLHYAALYNAKKVVPVLVTAGADVNAKAGFDGITALEIATQHRFRDMTRLLTQLQNNSHPESATAQQLTPSM